MRIVILRHGKSSLPPRPWIKAHDLGAWIDAYNRTGIAGKPPESAITAAKTCPVIVTSDLARSIESARALGPEAPLISDEIFREADLPFGPLGNVRLPPMVWALIFRIKWAFGFNARNGESLSGFRERSSHAASRLIALAEEHGAVLFVGHGLINEYIARCLLAAGWKGPGRPRLHHWASTEYTK